MQEHVHAPQLSLSGIENSKLIASIHSLLRVRPLSPVTKNNRSLLTAALSMEREVRSRATPSLPSSNRFVYLSSLSPPAH